MSTSSDLSRTHSYDDASQIPEEVWATMMQHEAAANIVLAFAQKALRTTLPGKQLWIVRWDNADNVEYVLSCTTGPLGDYPIFIFTPKSSAQLQQEEIREPLKELVLCLLKEVPETRVFSVFALAKVAETFASLFVENTPESIKVDGSPYYDATLMTCTRDMLSKPSDSISPLPEGEDLVISLRHADESVKDGIREMCQGFSGPSGPFVHTPERALLEAETLLENKQAWVHMIKSGEDEWDIACLVATTRESDNVAAITKVYTAERWRRRGCAARLVHRVCQDILKRKQQVVLYVGNGDSGELIAARKVYQKVGFQGLEPQQGQPDGVERWVEIGFKGTTLGYW